MALFAFGTAGVLVNEIDLTEQIRPSSTNRSALVHHSNFGPLGRTLTTSIDTWISTYGRPDPNVSFGGYSAVAAHREVNELWNLRVTRNAKHAGLSYFSQREAQLIGLEGVPFIDGFISRRERDYNEDDVWKEQAYFNIDLVFGGPIDPSNTITAEVAMVGVNEAGTIIDGSQVINVAYNTSSDQTLIDLSTAILSALDAINPGSIIEVISGGPSASDDRIIRINSPKGCRVAFPAINISGANAPLFGLESGKLFDIYTENPGDWGNRIAVRWSNIDKGQPQRISLRFNRSLVTGNVFSATVNGLPVSVNFSGNSDNTMALIAGNIQLALGDGAEAFVVNVGGGVSNDREIIVVAPNAVADMSITDVVVTGGTTQPTVVVSTVIDRIPPNETFTLEVFQAPDLTNPVEVFNVSLRDIVDAGSGLSFNIEQVINEGPNKSRFIRVFQPESSKNCDIRLFNLPPNINNPPQFLTGGDNGTIPSADDFMRAWENFREREQVLVSILINGGVTIPSVQRKLAEIAFSRKDCIAVLDMPADRQRAQDTIDYRRNVLNLDSNYAAIYSPDFKLDDEYTGRSLFVPPSGYIAATFALTDRVAAAWFSPAGLNRAELSRFISGLRYEYTKGETDAMAAAQINFIIKKKGFPVWNDTTLQYRSSALSNINVRRLLIVLETSIADSLDYNVFDPNDETTRFLIRQKIENFLNPIKDGRGLVAFRVVCDERNNKPEAVDLGILQVDVYVKPVLPAKYIKLNMVITKQGANFDELIAANVTG